MGALSFAGLDWLFSFVCGQGVAHSWAPGGTLLPCCQRCLGLYAGAFCAFLLHALLRTRLSGRLLEVHGLFLLLMVPLGFHWVPQGPALRAESGMLFGAAIATFLWLPCARPSPSHAVDSMRNGTYWFCLAIVGLALPIGAIYGGPASALALSTLAALGLLTLAYLVLGALRTIAIRGLQFVRPNPPALSGCPRARLQNSALGAKPSPPWP